MRSDPRRRPGGRTTTRLLAALLVLAGCGPAGCALTPEGRRATAEAIAADAGLAPRSYRNDPFTLSGWIRSGGDGPLVVVIEGDGYAWTTRTRPSRDPTPRDPIGLRLAAADPGARVLSLGRPCQYGAANGAAGGDAACDTRYWTTHRFAPEAIAALDAAVSAAKAETGAHRVVLAGFSGGGTAAALVALGRDDVERLITVAAPLDLAAWTRWHGVAPLSGSLDPATAGRRLARLPQRHLVGGKDEVVPPELARATAARLGLPPPVTVDGLSHGGDWAAVWAAERAAVR